MSFLGDDDYDDDDDDDDDDYVNLKYKKIWKKNKKLLSV